MLQAHLGFELGSLPNKVGWIVRREDLERPAVARGGRTSRYENNNNPDYETPNSQQQLVVRGGGGKNAPETDYSNSSLGSLDNRTAKKPLF